MTSKPPKLYGCGFNAFGQLFRGITQDVFLPKEIPEQDYDEDWGKLDLIFAGWSETAYYHSPLDVELTPRLIRSGRRSINGDTPLDSLVSGVGDHNGLLAVSDRDNRLFLAEDHMRDRESIQRRICHIAISGNGQVVAFVCTSPDKTYGRPLTFSSFENFSAWFRRADEVFGINATPFILPERLERQVVQLVANATSFAFLTKNGDVYTWGDARHGALGRDTVTTVADQPGLVESLAGIKIRKLASGGWITAALSEDGACYLFGSSTPGTENTITCLRDLDPNQAALVEIMDLGEPLDVLDVALGDGHIVVLVDGGRVFVTGENVNGQLGIGRTDFVEGWVEVDLPGRQRCMAVHAGPKSSFFELEENERYQTDDY